MQLPIVYADLNLTDRFILMPKWRGQYCLPPKKCVTVTCAVAIIIKYCPRLFSLRWRATRASIISSKLWLMFTHLCKRRSPSRKLNRISRSYSTWRSRLWSVDISYVTTLGIRILVCSFVWIVSDRGISRYHSLLGTRVLKNLISDVDDKIKQYETKFGELKSAFQGHAAIHTEITVLRVLNEVESIGEQVGA